MIVTGPDESRLRGSVERQRNRARSRQSRETPSNFSTMRQKVVGCGRVAVKI